jgi:CRP-like cAMP-binding protein
LRQLKPHQHAFYEGDPESHVYRISDGIVRLYKLLGDGRRQIISFRFPGDLIGFEPDEERSYSAEAVTDVTLQCLPASVAHRRVREEAQYSSELLGILSAELAEARHQLVVLNRRSALEKVAAFILDLCRRKGQSRLKLELGRGDMADFLGLTIETVSRTLTKLRRQKVIDLPQAHLLLVLDMERLEGFADGEGGN